MPSRRSLLSYVLGPAALTGGLLAVNRASARSATPEFVGIDGWLNTDGPLTIAGQRGRQRVPNLARMGQSSLAVILPSRA
jgi:hypothetical protein